MKRILKLSILAKAGGRVVPSAVSRSRGVNRVLRGMLAACLLTSPGVFADEPVVEEEQAAVAFGATDPEMLAAIAQARATLDDFLQLAGNPEPETSTFKLKVLVRDGDEREFFWVTPFRTVEDGFEGVLANRPEVVGNVRLGDTIRFTRAEIADWGYVRSGRQVGSFTVCVLFKHIPRQQADYFRKNNGFDC